MGCDFYTYYALRIEYKKGDEVKVKSEMIGETLERHYFWEIERRDEDFEELNDYYERCHIEKQQQIDVAMQKYETKFIFRNKTWLCTESAREKYINICKNYDISESDIISISKEGDFKYR